MPQLEFTLADGSVRYSQEIGEDPLPDLIEDIADGRRSWVQLEDEEWLNVAYVTTFRVYAPEPSS
jgi:hypothetical protein